MESWKITRRLILGMVALVLAGCGPGGQPSGEPQAAITPAADEGEIATAPPTAAATVAPTVAPTPVPANPAPELNGGGTWLNSEPLTLAGLRGKVVLVEFWTYGCINCQRTKPYVQAWWNAYRDDGLVIIGVHTPEFESEKSLENVQAAIREQGVTWPVVQDNEKAIWRAYGNRWWPRRYLIDRQGNIVYDHIGEGGYEETERRIVATLAEEF